MTEPQTHRLRPSVAERVASWQSAFEDPETQATFARRRDQYLREETRRVEACARRDEAASLVACGVPRRYLRESLAREGIPPELRAWAAGFPDSTQGAGGAILLGPVGCGKTAAAVWLIRELYRSGSVVGLETERLARWGWRGARFVSYDELLRAAGRLNVSDFGAEAAATLGAARRTALLVVDDWIDLGPAEKRAEIVEALVRERWHEGLPTIITANLLADCFRQSFPAVTSRLGARGGPGMVAMVGTDRRQEARSGGCG